MGKPVWLEEWEVPIPDDWTIWSKGDHRHLAQFDGRGRLMDTPEQRRANLGVCSERAKIAAAAPALVRALLRIEWGAHVEHDYHWVRACPACAEERIFNDWAARLKFEHKAGCHVDAALTAAGFPDQATRDEARRLIEAEGAGT